MKLIELLKEVNSLTFKPLDKMDRELFLGASEKALIAYSDGVEADKEEPSFDFVILEPDTNMLIVGRSGTEHTFSLKYV